MKSSYNLAMTNLMENFKIDYAASSISPDYPSLAFSRGNLLAPVPLSLKLPSEESLELSWQNNSAGNAERDNDFIQILMAAENENLTFFIENAAIRSNESYSVNLPVNFRNKTIHAWIAFRTEDGELVSNSQYAGSI